MSGQSTLATFSLKEYFGVGWPTQNIEMRYDAGSPNKSTTRMLNASGSEIPYQWISGANCWDPTAVNGCILVQDGLAPNATNTYTLQSGIAPAATVTNPVTVTSGTCQSGVAGWIVANGLTGFCVPKTQSSPYNYAPIQGIQLNSGVWTGAVSEDPNLIYQNPVTGTWPNSISNNVVLYGTGGKALTVPATILTGEVTTFVDSGPLKTSVRLSYTANRPLYYFTGGLFTKGGTATTLSVPYVSGQADCGTMGLYFTSATNLPAPLTTNTAYYNIGCALSGNSPGNTNYSTATYSLSTTPGGPPLTLSAYTGQVKGIDTVANVSGSGHLTVILTLYANRPAFSYDFDTDLNIQYFAPLYHEVQPDVRRYRGFGSDSAACGYETPLAITSITNTSPPVVTVSNTLNAQNGNQINISGVNGASGANGTFYVCSVNKAGQTFALNTSATCGASTTAPAPGVYTSGGIGKPQYQNQNSRAPRDAFYDISYSGNYFPALASCTSMTIPSLGINYPPNWGDAGYYDMVYNAQGGAPAPVVGLFQGRLSKQFNTTGSERSQPGWFSSNNHWIGAYNANCSSGRCAFGIEHVMQVNELATTTHGNFGIYVGSVGQLLPPDWTQPIKVEQNTFEGINLSSLYTYTLNYPDPQPGNPPNNGWTWPYMNAADFSAWVSLFQHSASYCASSGTCTGDNGYYNMMKVSEPASGAIQDLWHYNDAAHAASAYRQVLNEGAVGGTHTISGASWSGGVETLVIGPHAIVAGQTVTITGFTPSAYNCSLCMVTAVTPATISYNLASNPAAYTVAGYVAETGIQGFINELANYENLWFPNTSYYQLFLNEFVYAFPQCTALILNSNSTQSQRTGCKVILGLAGSLLWDNDWWPTGNINGNGTTTSGDNGGLQNQIVQWYQDRAEAALQLYFHPYLASKVASGNSYTLGSINAMANQYGSGASSMHYQGAYTVPTYEAFETSALNGSFPNFTFANPNYPWRQHAGWYLSGLTPPEPRFGNVRKCLSNGDGNTEAECAVSLGLLAEGLASVDATTAGNAIWGWAQTNTPNKTYTVDQNDVWAINPLVPSVTPTLTSINFPGYWSVARYGFGTPYETSVHFINGDFYSLQGHRHDDDGQISIYAQSAPLAIDWNANLYNPDMGASYCHNRVVLDSEISGTLGAWNSDAPNCAVPGANSATGPLLKAVETNFNAFLNSTQSIADFVYGDSTIWTRAVRTIAANPAYPLIYVKDSFSGPSAAVSKTITWNLMATGSVVTPAGVVTPIVRYSGPPNAATGCNSPAAQYPSNGTVYSLANGLEQFTFTGASWRAHATGGINWDLWQIPSSGSAQFFIGNWGHGCNNVREMAEFQAANGVPFNERQHILRVHDTGTFQTLIAPYRNGETPMRTITIESCGIQVVQGPEVTCFNDSALTYTNGTRQVLTVYDGTSQSAFGFTASGGAQELVNNGSGTITWTIEDIVAATRCVTLPAGASLQSGTGVQYNATTGQYCYNQGASLQPTPATVTFTVQ